MYTSTGYTYVHEIPEISILIGSDFPQLYVSQDIGIGKVNEPIAIVTPLGWVLMVEKGKTNHLSSNVMANETENLSNKCIAILDVRKLCKKRQIFQFCHYNDRKL